MCEQLQRERGGGGVTRQMKEASNEGCYNYGCLSMYIQAIFPHTPFYYAMVHVVSQVNKCVCLFNQRYFKYIYMAKPY